MVREPAFELTFRHQPHAVITALALTPNFAPSMPKVLTSPMIAYAECLWARGEFLTDPFPCGPRAFRGLTRSSPSPRVERWVASSVRHRERS